MHVSELCLPEDRQLHSIVVFCKIIAKLLTHNAALERMSALYLSLTRRQQKTTFKQVLR